VFFRCRCSRERVAGMLQGLGESEIQSVIAERGEVEVRCDFCNRAYRFDPVDAAQLFNSGVPATRGSPPGGSPPGGSPPSGTPPGGSPPHGWPPRGTSVH
jgi:hypothetical protein